MERFFKAIVFIAGNHEYYGTCFKGLHESLVLRYKDDPKVHYLEKSKVVIDDVTFVGGMLWTDYDKEDPDTMQACVGCTPDSRHIKDSKVYHMLEEHKRTVSYFEKALEEKTTEKVVIISHHAPSHRSVHESFIGDITNGAFVSDLEHIITKFEPTLWVHGHLHNFSDYFIEKTRIVCNPRGYISEKMSEDFNPEFTLEI